jgi:hypothetical protein
MLGIVLAFVGSLFMPGAFLIDTIDPFDYTAAIDAWADNAVLAQWMTFISLIAMLFLIFGVLGLYPLASSQGGLAGRLLQFGIVASVIEWSVMAITHGMRHFSIILLQRGDPGHAGIDAAAVAFDIHLATIAVTLAFMALFPIGTLLTGLGLAARFGPMNIYKIASYLLVIGGIVGLVNFIIALNSPDVALDLLLYVNSAVLYVGGISLFIIGLGMYQGRSELSAESA